MKKLELKVGDEEVIGVYPRANDTLLLITKANHYLLKKRRDELWVDSIGGAENGNHSTSQRKA